MKSVLILFLTLPSLAFAQDTVQFASYSNWQEVEQRASIEHRPIFVEFYATWCEPCRMMEKTVYTNENVARILNNGFIAIKVQYDTSKNDDDEIKLLYSEAHRLVTEYKITAYPSFLFFSPEGKLLHKGIGYQNPASFVDLVKDAGDTDRQFYTLLDRYWTKKIDYPSMGVLAVTAKKNLEIDLAWTIAKDYMQNYLNNLSDSNFCTKSNFQFMGFFSSFLTSRDRAFNWYLRHQQLVDAAVEVKGYSELMADRVIFKEEITPQIEAAKRDGHAPEWKNIRKALDSKFGPSVAEKNLSQAKIQWFWDKHDWDSCAVYLVRQLRQDTDKASPSSPMNLKFLNQIAWETFLKSDNKVELEKAVTMSEIVIQNMQHPDGNYIDTKANLLYKLGRRQDALVVETQASQVSPGDISIRANLEKMQQGKPTW